MKRIIIKLTKHIYIALFIFFMGHSSIIAQTHISGNVKIDLKTGLFECKFKLENLPEIENYKVLLNKGFNVKYFKEEGGAVLNYAGYFEPFIKGEALGYHFRDPKRNKINLPKSFEVSYIGAFPKYENDLNAFDFKGLIAINDKTLRATEQTKWHPVLYDVTKDKLFDSYTYDIEIEIKGGTTIFINGSSPKKITKSRFISEKQVPLFLFVGTYNFVENNGDFILNTNVIPKNAGLIFNNIELIKKSLSRKLNQQFTDNIYLIKHKAVNKRKAGSSWGFNVYPSFAFTGLDFNDLVKENKRFKDSNTRYFAHEFAHNYFSNNVNSGPLKWFWLESFPEYLSFSVAKELCDKNYLPRVLLSKAKLLSDKNFNPLSIIKNQEEINDAYRYSMAPLILQCFEVNFGAEKINKVIISLLKKANQKTLTLNDWRESALESGISELEFKTFSEKFIDSREFKNNVIDFITKKYSK